MKLGALCSGGKDSSYALWLASKKNHEIENIISMYPEKENSWMFHKPEPETLHLFAEASNLPLIEGKTSGGKVEELEDLKSLLENIPVEGIVNGAVASTYQKERIEKICEEIGLISITPLWNKNPFSLLRGMVDGNFETVITSVSAMGFSEEWLGRKIDGECIGDLRKLNEQYKVHPLGEGGEYETLTLDAPFFEKKICLKDTSKNWKGDRGVLEIKDVGLVEK